MKSLHGVGWASVGMLLLAGILLGWVGIARADGGDTTLIHACLVDRAGRVRIVHPSDFCHRHETPIHWPGTAGAAAPQVHIRSGDTTIDFDSAKALRVDCPPSLGVIGGGAQILPAPYVEGVVLQSSGPVGPPNDNDTPGWFATAWRVFGPSPLAWGLRVTAICTTATFSYSSYPYYGASLMGPVRPAFAWASLLVVGGVVVAQVVSRRRTRN